jgi:hypothetical protein
MPSPSRLVSATCPSPASAATARVFARLQPRARDTSTNGSQCVGIAAWKNATVKPVAATVVSTAEFMAGGREKTGLRALSTPNTTKVVKGHKPAAERNKRR